MNPLPAPRKVPVVPRPRHGELSGSYLARVAQANRIGFRSFLCPLGAVPSAVARNNRPDLAVMVLTFNDTAFSRLLAYTGLDAVNLIKAVPSLAPQSQAQGEPPAIRLSFLKPPVADCPGCRARRGGAYVLGHKAACLRHGYFYEHLASELGISDGRPLKTVRTFDPLPADIHAQAERGRVLNDPDWNTLPPPDADRLRILNLDITDGYAKCFPGCFLAAG